MSAKFWTGGFKLISKWELGELDIQIRRAPTTKLFHVFVFAKGHMVRLWGRLPTLAKAEEIVQSIRIK